MPEEPLDTDQQPQFSPQPSEEPITEEPELIQPPAAGPMLQQSVPPMGLEPQTHPTPVMEPVLTPFKSADVPSEAPIIMSEPVMQAPSESVSDETMSAPIEKPSWFKKNKLLVIVGVSTLLVVILAVSAFAVTSWYQNPQKVITDSIVNAFTSKTAIYDGNLMVDGNGTKVSVTINSKLADATGSLDAKVSLTMNSKTYDVDGSALFDKNGDLFFKVEKLAGIVAELKSSTGLAATSPLATAVDKLVAKIDGTWVKISSNDLKQYSQATADAKNCVNDTIKKFKDDKSAIAEISDVYNKNQFIVVDKDLGQKDGSFGYQIKSDSKVLTSFEEGLAKTKVYEYIHACDSTIDIKSLDTTSTSTTSSNGTVKLWVDVWSHQITKIEANGTSDGTTTSMTVSPKFNQAVTITAPDKSITLSELQVYITDLMSSVYFD